MVILDGIKHPIRERDLDIEHAPFPRLLHDFGRVDQAEDLEVLLPPLPQVRFDLCPLKAAKCVLQQFIPTPDVWRFVATSRS